MFVVSNVQFRVSLSRLRWNNEKAITFISIQSNMRKCNYDFNGFVRPQSNCMTECNCIRNILNYLVNFRFSWFVTTVDWLHSDFNLLSVAIMFIVRFIDVGSRFRILSLLWPDRGWALVSSGSVTFLIYRAYLGGFNGSFGRGMKLFPMLHCGCI